MNILKIQQDFLKLAYERDNKSKYETMLYGFSDNYIVFANDTVLYKILKGQCYLNPELTFKRMHCSIEKLLDDENAMTATDTKTSIIDTHEVKKRTLRKFILEDGESAYINEQLLKHFDLDISTFKCASPISPLFVYEYGEMVGLVLPIRYSEN